MSVIAPTAMQADILATAVSVMGKEKGLGLVESMEDVEAILIDSASEGEMTKTGGAEAYIE